MQRRESYVEMKDDDAFDDENVTSGIGDVNRVGMVRGVWKIV